MAPAGEADPAAAPTAEKAIAPDTAEKLDDDDRAFMEAAEKPKKKNR